MAKPSFLLSRLHGLLCALPLALTSVAAGQISTSALAVPVLLPSAIVFDSAGDLYLADAASHVIRRVTPAGVTSTIAGTGMQGFSGDNGPATAAMLDSPQGLALDNGNNLYFSDTHNHRIRKVNLVTGIVISIAGGGTPGFSGDNGPAAAAALNLPIALATDGSNNLYIADTGNQRIRRVDAATGIMTAVAGNGTQGFAGDNGPATSASIDSPAGLAISGGSLYLADSHNHRIRKVDLTSGLITTLAGTGTLGFSGDGAVASGAALALPRGITFDSSGNLYLADTENHRIRVITAATGAISTVAGNGTQGFSGDGGPAVSASLDSPNAVALPPSTLLTLTDTGNQRIRQLDAAPSPGPDIHTLAGVGVTLPGVLTLSAPSVIAYGSGQVLAALSTSSPATGSIVFFNAAASSALGTAALAGNLATLPTGDLAAGSYVVIATYSGDQGHLAAQSSAVSFRVAPQTLIASAASLSVVYGAAVPSLTGTITGVLPQDEGKVAASFVTTASALSSAGTYPIAVSLSGPAAGNYTVAAPAANVTISPASTSISFSGLVASAAAGTDLNFAVRVSSGVPGTASMLSLGGTVTLLDSGIPLGTVPVLSSGLASFNNVSLATGVHTVTAVYNGSSNFDRSISSSQQVTIVPGVTPPAPPSPPPAPPAPSSDFTLAATSATSQTVLSGTSANFTFAIQPQGSSSSPVTLAATGLPHLATASFNPPTVPPSATVTTFSLTVATPQTAASTNSISVVWAVLFLPTVGLTLRTRWPRRAIRFLAVVLAGGVLLTATGCGNRVNTASAAAAAASQSYTITVTGTTTTFTGGILQHSVNVTLILQPAG